MPNFQLALANCGCIGIKLGAKDLLVLRPCDNADGEYTCHVREMREVITETTDAEPIISEIQSLIADGYAMRDIRRLIKRGF